MLLILLTCRFWLAENWIFVKRFVTFNRSRFYQVKHIETSLIQIIGLDKKTSLLKKKKKKNINLALISYLGSEATARFHYPCMNYYVRVVRSSKFWGQRITWPHEVFSLFLTSVINKASWSRRPIINKRRPFPIHQHLTAINIFIHTYTICTYFFFGELGTWTMHVHTYIHHIHTCTWYLTIRISTEIISSFFRTRDVNSGLTHFFASNVMSLRLKFALIRKH